MARGRYCVHRCRFDSRASPSFTAASLILLYLLGQIAHKSSNTVLSRFNGRPVEIRRGAKSIKSTNPPIETRRSSNPSNSTDIRDSRVQYEVASTDAQAVPNNPVAGAPTRLPKIARGKGRLQNRRLHRTRVIKALDSRENIVYCKYCSPAGRSGPYFGEGFENCLPPVEIAMDCQFQKTVHCLRITRGLVENNADWNDPFEISQQLTR
ncbi:hypothetical protein B0H19DRAFT_1351519 [Mycena capillaripes]|nr:hypothetical protein B0H19DRAFT_1351519 [Mycena capillaripes]